MQERIRVRSAYPFDRSREVECQPVVWPYRKQHGPCTRMAEFSFDHPLGGLLGQVSFDDCEHLLRRGGRSDPTMVPSTVTYLYGNASRWTDRLSTPSRSTQSCGTCGPAFP